MIEWLLVILLAVPAGLYVGARDGMRAARARIDADRAKVGLSALNRRHELALGVRRTWRILRHPIRERALLAESFRALKNPATHKWSDGLS